MKLNKLFYIITVIFMLFFLACGPKPLSPKSELDTPEHHTSNGIKLLEAGKIDEALDEFIRAKELNPKFSLAYTGLGIAYGFKKNFQKGFENLKTADKYADQKEEKISMYIGYMRLYIMAGEKHSKSWLKEVESKYKKAINLNLEASEAHYYMGIAYKKSFAFAEASDKFTKVLSINKGFIKEADKEYSIIQKIQRAVPGTEMGKKIAILDGLSRADVAALFIQELKIDELFARKNKKNFDSSFKSPEKEFETGQYVKLPPATDIEDHVLKADIKAVMEMGLKGLQPFPDHTFAPDKMVTRAEFAMMIEDILMKITGDEQMSTKFIENESPFADLRSDLPYFNAVMICTTRGILEVVDKSNGQFDPNGVITGADALLSIRMLKSQL